MSAGQPSGEAPFFAIAMPAFNAQATIAEALDSVLAQTFTAWEMVVVDDGSTDATRQRAEAFAARDERIRVISQENAGTSAARAGAIAATRAAYILTLDADDVLLSSCLETYAAFIATHPSRDIYSCDAEVFGPDGDLGRYYGAERFPAKPEFVLADLLERCVIVGPASVISRAHYERVGGLRPDAYAEDYDLWLRALALGGRHIMVPEALVRYRLSPSQKTASVIPMVEGTAEALQHVADSGLLDRRQTRVARTSARRSVLHARHLRADAVRGSAIVAREEFEERLCHGDLRDARREFLRVRPAYQSTAKFAVATPLMVASPRLYAACLRRVRARRDSSSSAGGDR